LNATDPNGLIPNCGGQRGACEQSTTGRPETVAAPAPPVPGPSQNYITEAFIHANPNSYEPEAAYYDSAAPPGAHRQTFYQYFVQSYEGNLIAVPDEGDILENLVIGVNVCPIACISPQMQGGQVSLSVGGIGLFSRGVYVGYANLPVCKRQKTSVFVSGGEAISGSASTGVDKRNNLVPSDTEVDFGVGAGGLPISGAQWATFSR
jgi:hypothetical protein